jgi:hypothetical protein
VYATAGERFLALARLLHGHRLDKQGALVPLAAEEQRDGLKALRDKYSAAFTVTGEQVRAWHRREAEACVKKKNPAPPPRCSIPFKAVGAADFAVRKRQRP